MTLVVHCPDCSKTLRVKDEAAGKKIRCPGCSTAFQVPAKPKDADDDFLGGLDEALSKKNQGRPVDDDFDDDDELAAAPRPRKVAKKVKKKKSGSGSNVMPAMGKIFGTIFCVLMILGSVVKLANRLDLLTTWRTFKHPSGLAQVDMPGTPTFNPQLSVQGAQVYVLMKPKLQTSLSTVELPANAQAKFNSNPAAVDLAFELIKSSIPQQTPGSRVVSSRRLTAGTIPGMEAKVESQGTYKFMRFYLFPQAMVVAEFYTRDEVADAGSRDKFFNSLRGPDGNLLVNNPGQATAPSASSPNTSVPNLASPNPAAAPNSAVPSTPIGTLTNARRGFQTKLVRKERSGQALPDPPAQLARIVRYDAPGGKLGAYLTTIPQDGKKHRAIIWISGGDCNTIDTGFFTEAPPANDQTASAFWKAGIVTMYPSLRGGNDNPGFKEGFLGEVDDVIAAAEFLAKQDGIDSSHIYLGGHSTGGTLALLVAECPNPFRAIFSFGPVDDIRGYGPEFLLFDQTNATEVNIRNPVHWMDSLQNQTFVVEGARGNASSLLKLQQSSKNSKAVCLLVPRADHFSILGPGTSLVAEKILADEGPIANISLTLKEFPRASGH